MRYDEIKKEILKFKSEKKRLFLSSSFQTQSVPLLHMISKIDHSIPVIFIHTSFHFPETLLFRDKLTNILHLNTISIKSHIPLSQQRDQNGKLFFISDPDRCCYYNKVEPLNRVLPNYDVWISGVRADQNENRKAMKVVQKTPGGIVRFHPILDWTAKMIYEYIRKNNLPKHPLEEKGFPSIGCEPCTWNPLLSDARSGRWVGQKKTECGLHTDLLGKRRIQ